MDQFVVDGEWITDHTAPQESDGSSNINNVLLPEQITKRTLPRPAPEVGAMSTVTPQSTTAGLAGDVPKESTRERGPDAGSSLLPGTFPATPAQEKSDFSVNPIPETAGIGNPVNLAPGEKVPDPSTLTSNTISSTVRDDESLIKKPEDPQQTFNVSPLPPSSGIGNPIHLEPGEKVPPPSAFTANTINTAVTTDKDSYVNSSGAPQLPDVVTPANERDATGGMFGLPDISGNMIPESSLPMGGGPTESDPGVTIQSAGPNSTTAALAGQVPLEPRGTPEVVRDTQKDVGKSYEERDPVATIQSAGPDSTTAGLAGDVPLEPREARGLDQERDPNVTIQSAGPGATTAGLAGSVPLEPRGAPELNQDRDPGVTIQSAGPNATTAGLAGTVPLEPRGVPKVVQDSQKDADFAPEASANPEAVGEKTAVEEELESKVPKEPATSEGIAGQTSDQAGDKSGGLAASVIAAAAGAGAGAGAGGTGYGLIGKSSEETSSLPSRGLPASVQQSINEINQGTPIAPTVPDVVQESIARSNQSPEAAGSQTMVGEKSAMESELLNEVKTTNAVGEAAPSSSAALTETAPAITTSAPTIQEQFDTAKDSKLSSRDTPAAEPATTETSTPHKPAMAEAIQNRHDSRDISPMSHPVGSSQTGPSVTTGVGKSSAPQISKPAPAPSSSTARPSQATSEGSASSDKKSKRASGFFGKLKSKFSDKDKR